MKYNEQLVKMTAATGLPPLELRLTPILDCHTKRQIAYRSETRINSVTFGVLPFSAYHRAADGAAQGVRLAWWSIGAAIAAIRRFEEAGQKIRFLSVRCPAALAAEAELSEQLAARLRAAPPQTPARLCLEFPLSVLSLSVELVSRAVREIKRLQVGTMLAGAAGMDCPIARLTDIPFDYALLDPAMTRLADSRNKGTVISMLLQYLRSMRIEIIGEGVCGDPQIAALARGDCAGYIPAAEYRGNAPRIDLSMTVDEAIAQQEKEEG